MCTNHDRLHFPEHIRKAATILAVGNAERRDLMMRSWAVYGLYDFLERYHDEIATTRYEAARSCLRMELERIKPEWDDAQQEIVNDWQAELETLIKALIG